MLLLPAGPVQDWSVYSLDSRVRAFESNHAIGLKIHLFTIIPASVIVVFQFIPVIRHKIMLFHRLNGYAVVILSFIANAGALMATKHAFGGDFATQTWTGTMVILTTIGMVMAYINIKLLQIDQHRAWMLRVWAWVRMDFQH